MLKGQARALQPALDYTFQSSGVPRLVEKTDCISNMKYLTFAKSPSSSSTVLFETVIRGLHPNDNFDKSSKK
eukprot:IDg19891t1